MPMETLLIVGISICYWLAVFTAYSAGFDAGRKRTTVVVYDELHRHGG
jgi:hypothetical protein